MHMLSHAFGCGPRHTVTLVELFTRCRPRVHFRLRVRPTVLPRSMHSVLTSLPTKLLRLRTNVRDLQRSMLSTYFHGNALTRSLSKLHFLYSLPGIIARTSLVTKLPHCALRRVCRSVRALTDCRTKRVRLRSLGLLPKALVHHRTISLRIHCSPVPPCRILRASTVDDSRLRRTHHLSHLLSTCCGAST